ncbi:hypothetical protein Q9966_016447, partial [Columba livia]
WHQHENRSQVKERFVMDSGIVECGRVGSELCLSRVLTAAPESSHFSSPSLKNSRFNLIALPYLKAGAVVGPGPPVLLCGGPVLVWLAGQGSRAQLDQCSDTLNLRCKLSELPTGVILLGGLALSPVLQSELCPLCVLSRIGVQERALQGLSPWAWLGTSIRMALGLRPSEVMVHCVVMMLQ